MVRRPCTSRMDTPPDSRTWISMGRRSVIALGSGNSIDAVELSARLESPGRTALYALHKVVPTQSHRYGTTVKSVLVSFKSPVVLMDHLALGAGRWRNASALLFGVLFDPAFGGGHGQESRLLFRPTPAAIDVAIDMGGPDLFDFIDVAYCGSPTVRRDLFPMHRIPGGRQRQATTWLIGPFFIASTPEASG